MVYEKHLASLSALRRELETLDGDAGVRVLGSYGGVRSFAFVTRFGGTFTVIVCPARGNAGGMPGRIAASKESTDVEDVVGFLKSISGPKVHAYAY